jgi:hypothetical protein
MGPAAEIVRIRLRILDEFAVLDESGNSLILEDLPSVYPFKQTSDRNASSRGNAYGEPYVVPIQKCGG